MEGTNENKFTRKNDEPAVHYGVDCGHLYLIKPECAEKRWKMKIYADRKEK